MVHKTRPASSPATSDALNRQLTEALIEIISETNGITLMDTLELLSQADGVQAKPELHGWVVDFQTLLQEFQIDQVDIETLLAHPVAQGLFGFFKNFPLPYRDEHTHLTGALSAEFI